MSRRKECKFFLYNYTIENFLNNFYIWYERITQDTNTSVLCIVWCTSEIMFTEPRDPTTFVFSPQYQIFLHVIELLLFLQHTSLVFCSHLLQYSNNLHQWQWVRLLWQLYQLQFYGNIVALRFLWFYWPCEFCTLVHLTGVPSQQWLRLP